MKGPASEAGTAKTIPVQPSSQQIFSGVCVAQSLVFRVVFYGAVNFGHSIVCPLMYSFRLPL